MKHLIKVILFLGIIALFITYSCINKTQYPIEPHIDFVSFSTLADVNNLDSIGKIIISYTDGDGDLGYNTNDTNNAKYDFFIKLFQLKNGNEIELIPPDTNFSLNARLPYLTPNGDNMNIKGEISFLIELFLIRPALISDTIAFEMFIADRALNQSNVIKTPYYIIAK